MSPPTHTPASGSTPPWPWLLLCAVIWAGALLGVLGLLWLGLDSTAALGVLATVTALALDAARRMWNTPRPVTDKQSRPNLGLPPDAQA